MNPQKRKLTAGDVDAYLAPLKLTLRAQPLPEANQEIQDAYRAAAAVLAGIADVAQLKPFFDGPVSPAPKTVDPAKVLGPDLVENSASVSLGGKRILSFDARRAALRRLGTRGRMLKALEANPQERNGPVQTKFEQYIQGTAKPLNQQKLEELDESLQAILWLEGLGLPGVPTTDDARQAMERAQFLRTFEKVAGDHFQGRVTDLDRLRRFVGILPPQSRSQQFISTASRLLGVEAKPVMSLYGPGGIGKTALVMRFCREHLQIEDIGKRVPFAYLDFDSPFLNIKDLSTIATEMVRQLKIQFPDFSAPVIPADPEDVATALGAVLASLSLKAKQPYLIVLDTFEEVQYAGESNASGLWTMLTNLQLKYPFLRVLVSGRAPVKYFQLGNTAADNFELGGLDEPAALAIVSSAGVTASDLASALVKQVGRVPLSLRLAAAVVKREGAGASGINNLRTTEYLLFKVSDEVIQGQLYERILDHIHNCEVAKLANPGLVLRFITPELIFEVLRAPCKLSAATKAEAENLYNELARETALVSEESGQMLRHRQDLRRTMLTMMSDKHPRQTKLIHELAIQYYAARTDMVSKAEELYHRLMTNAFVEPALSIASFERYLKSSEVRSSLSPSLRELPVAGQLELASYGYDVDPEILKRASAAQLEAHAAARIEDLVRQGASGIATALSELRRFRYRGADSPLYLAESRILFLQSGFAPAITLLDEGLAYASACGSLERIVQLLALKCWTLEVANRWDELGAALDFLEDYATRLERKLELTQVWAQRLRLEQNRKSMTGAETAAKQLAPLLEQLSITGYALISGLLAGSFTATSSFTSKPLTTREMELRTWILPTPQGWPFLPYVADVSDVK